MKKLLFVLLAIISLNNITIAQTDATEKLINEYVQTLPDNAEVAIGVIKDGEVSTFGYIKQQENLVPIENNTRIFEIGSMTKTYTGALLVEQVKNGKMQMDDSMVKYIESNERIENDQLNLVTLKHLVTHTSGLNANPKSFVLPAIRGSLFTNGNPYIFIKWKHFRKSLRKESLTSVPGEEFLYSNAGFGLLGKLIAEHENTTWEELVQTRIFDELGMNNSYPTGKNVPDELFVQGYNEESEPSDYWDMDFVNPAGSIKSCVKDQLIWLSAHLNAEENSVYSEMKKSYDIDAMWDNSTIGNAWIHQIVDDKDIIWHGGASGAFRSFSAFDDESQTAVVILTNFKHNHPQMRDENNRSIIRKYGFDVLTSLSSEKEYVTEDGITK